MRHLTMWQIELLPWYAFMVVWAVGLLWLKPVKTTEPLAARLFNLAVIGTAFWLLFSPGIESAILTKRLFPQSIASEWAGIGITWAGAAIAIWARFILGANWSAIVSLKAGHELIRTGPYAYVRHPIYTGLLVAVIGTAIEVGEWRGLPAIALAAIGVALKAQREEQFLMAEFGENYAQYRESTGALLPKL